MKILKYLCYSILTILLVTTILGHTGIGNLGPLSYGKKMMHLKIGDNQIRYAQTGTGKDLLFIHGTPGSMEDWDYIRDTLAKNYRVTTYDRLGHGYSSNNDYDYNLEDNAELVKQIITKLELQSPMIIGHSYGGSTVAQLLVDHYNDSLDYMIIDSPLMSYKPNLPLRLISIPVIGKGLCFLANYTIAENMIADGIKNAVINQNEKQLEKIISTRKDIWLQPKVLYSKAKESMHYDQNLKYIANHYKDITANVIVVTGADAEITFLNDAKAFCKSVNTDSLVIIPNTAHYIQLDQSEKIIELIRNQLN